MCQARQWPELGGKVNFKDIVEGENVHEHGRGERIPLDQRLAGVDVLSVGDGAVEIVGARPRRDGLA
ncbi:MAG: hypothetical protein ABI779_24455 [Acidobacteriota bacterium]